MLNRMLNFNISGNNIVNVLFAVAWLFSTAYNFVSVPFSLNGFGTTLLLSNTIGFPVSLLLVWNDVDAHNPFLKEVCGGQRGKLNCNTILTSKGASIFRLSWSVLGFSYFSTILFSQLLFGPSNPRFISYWLLLSLLVLPYTVYSVYYQWRVVKQWCLLCLIIQAVLFLSGMLFFTYFYQYSFSFPFLLPLCILLFMGLSILIITSRTIPILKSAKESMK